MSGKHIVFVMFMLFVALVGSGLANATTLDIVAYIDGRDRLHFKGDSLWWEHLDFAAVGRHGGNNLPTKLTVDHGSTIEWVPNWPGHPWPDEIRTYAVSDPLTAFSPALAAQDQTVGFTGLTVRGSAGIVQQPSSANGYELTVEFNDNAVGMAGWYWVRLDYIPAQVVPLPSASLLLGTGLLALLGAYRLRHR